MSIAQLGSRIEEQIRGFSGILSMGLGKVQSRFVGQMIYGIQTRQSTRLSQIARSLKEKTSLKKVIERLSRNLGHEGLGSHVVDAVAREGSSRLGSDTLLVVDISEIVKPYGKKMEYLADVRDASHKRIRKGYWTLNVIGCECGEHEITPLWLSLWSQNATGFQSENMEILHAVDGVRRHTGDKGVWVMDRGGDRRTLLIPLLERQARFLIRMQGDRHVVFRGQRRTVADVATGCLTPYIDVIIKEEKGQEVPYRLEYGFRKVKLPGRDERLCLIVVKGLGKEPLMLLTNMAVRKKRTLLWWFVQSYLTRWRIEDTIRFFKQSYDLEDIRVLRYRRLQNMMAMVLGAAYFASAYLGVRAKLRVMTGHVLQAAQRIFGIPDFRYYAIADGISEILRRWGKGLRPRPLPDRLPGQQLLFD
jgi:hypothetical protein